MPDFSLGPRDQEDLIAYIFSLRQISQRGCCVACFLASCSPRLVADLNAPISWLAHAVGNRGKRAFCSRYDDN
jgi:hypothetical protein